MKTFMANAQNIERKWYVLDAENRVLGRVATQTARLLRGKHKPTYTPHVDTGDYVIVVNVDKIVLTGKKLDQKKYYRHSGFVGGLKEESAKNMLENKPEEMFIHAVKGMIPHNALGRKMIKKLKVYAGPEHDNAAQKPEKYEI